MDLQFTSGQVCKIFGITKQTLLFYDKTGILKPKYKNHSNGYRYYTIAQFDLLYLILSLRETGVSLRKIKSLIADQRTINETSTLLENQISDIQKKIESLQTAKNKLHKNLIQIKQIKEIRNYDFMIKSLPEQYLLAIPVHYVDGFPDYYWTLFKITERMATNSIPFDWKVGCITSLAPSKELKDTMFIELDTLISDEYVRLKPAGNYLCTYHYGPYETLENTYNNLLSHIKSNQLTITGDLYESYIINSLATDNENDYITELSVAIRNERN